MTLRIEEIIDRISTWQGKPVSFKPVYGGITNQNFKVIVENESFFVSVSCDTSEFLGVNLSNKFHNNKICEKLNLSPKIIYFLAKEGVLISEFLPIPPLSAKSMHNSDIQKRLIISLKKLHNGPSFLKKFDMFNLIKYYLKIAADKNIIFPAGYDDYLLMVESIGNTLKPYRRDLVPCLNDLIPENILYDGRKIYIIDFDYSGQNDLCFDLGNLFIESNFNDIQIREFLENYFGYVSEKIVSRTYLHGILSDVGWSLWSFIQDRISNIDFDFKAYGLSRWQRVLNKMDSGSVDKCLQYF